MSINEFVEKISQKYGYSLELENYLKTLLPALITYYGEDKREIIYNALLSCEIHIQEKGEDCNNFLKQYFNRQKDINIPFLAGAFYENDIQLRDMQVVLKSIIYIRTYDSGVDFNDERKLAILTHEICHAIKGYKKLEITPDGLINSTGLIKDYYQLDASTNEFVEVKSDNTGLEEGLNSYDEKQIMTIMTGKPFEGVTYPILVQIIEFLDKIPNLLEVIKTSQFTGNNEWIDFLGPEQAQFLATNMEKVYLPFVSDLSNEKKFIKLRDDMYKAADNLVQFVENYEPTIKK